MIAFEYASAKPRLLPETSNIAGRNRWFILAIRRVNGDTQVCQIKNRMGWSVSLIMLEEGGGETGLLITQRGLLLLSRLSLT